MKSTIKIEFDFETKEPYIAVKLVISEDLRDQMLKSFFEKLAGDKNLLYVSFEEDTLSQGKTIKMNPITTPLYASTNEEDGKVLLYPLVNKEDDGCMWIGSVLQSNMCEAQ